MTIETLLKKAKQARENSYAPYSNFHVGCCILADNNEFYAGTNVENACYPCGECAESTAIGNMIVAGAKHIKEILVIGSGDTTCFPCGNCRQKISEFATEATQVHVVAQDDSVQTYTLAELLPSQFLLQ